MIRWEEDYRKKVMPPGKAIRLIQRPRGSDRMGCANVAHAFAALPGDDKLRIVAERAPHIGIVTAYNDMLSAHQPFETYPAALKQAVIRAGGIAQFAGGVPAILGQDPRRTYMWLHMGKEPSRDQPHATYRGPDFSADYHIFAVDWQPERVVWYIDGVERFRFEGDVPQAPMHLIANLTVGLKSTWGSAPTAATQFPAVYSIDYIRVYQKD